MNKVLLGTAISVAAVTAIAATSMVVTDTQIDNVISHLTSSSLEPLTVAVIEDENSLFERNVSFSITFDDGQQPIVIIVDNQLSKKPWGTEITHSVALDDSILDDIYDVSARELMQKLFVNQALLEATTHVSMTGTYQTNIETLDVQETVEDVSIQFHPMRLSATGNMSGAIEMSGQWSGFSIVADDLEKIDFSFLPVEFQAEGKYINGSVFEGQQVLTGEGFNFSMESEWASQGLTGQSYELVSSGDVVGNDFSGELSFNSEGLTYQGDDSLLTVNDIGFSFVIAGIDIDNYQSLVEELNKMQTTGVPSPALMQSANVLLRNGFGLSLNDWHANIEGHSVALDADFELPENEIADANNPFSLMGLVTQFSATADVTMDSALADIPEISEPLLGVLMTGVFVSEGDQYTLAFSMKDGIAELNGEVLPLPF
jgi:uncharacterized protein YdgA (DUF945 family)